MPPPVSRSPEPYPLSHEDVVVKLMMNFLIDLVGEVENVAGVEPVIDAEGVLVGINRRGPGPEAREVELGECDPGEVCKAIPEDVFHLGKIRTTVVVVAIGDLGVHTATVDIVADGSLGLLVVVSPFGQEVPVSPAIAEVKPPETEVIADARRVNAVGVA